MKNINTLSKTVTISKNDQYGRIAFIGGTIEDWKIVFKNNYNYDENVNSHKKVDENGYTGCLSFFDIKIVNVSIESFNSSISSGSFKMESISEMLFISFIDKLLISSMNELSN